jgi:disulfide bond formation protein DsbB
MSQLLQAGPPGDARRMILTREKLLALFVGVAGLVALGIALGSERWGGLVPCALCLLERWPYRILIALGAVGLVVQRPVTRLVLVLAMLTSLAGAGLGAIHVGVEQGFWPSPLPECAAPRFEGGSIAQRLASMPVHPSKPCDDPTYLIPGLPLSMAAMNLIYALAVTVVVGVGLAKRSEQ